LMDKKMMFLTDLMLDLESQLRPKRKTTSKAMKLLRRPRTKN